MPRRFRAAVSATRSKRAGTVVGRYFASFRRRHDACIPTIFISYTGESLDYKVPLLKALEAVNKAAVEVCRLFIRK